MQKRRSTLRPLPLALTALALAVTAGCSQQSDETTTNPDATATAAQDAQPVPKPALHSGSNFRLDPIGDQVEPKIPQSVFKGERSQDILRAQVLLDRARFSPGAIDGAGGENLKKAVRAYETANGMPATGEVTPDLLQRLAAADRGPIVRTYEITSEDVQGPFASKIPDGMAAQAKLDALSYTSAAELLAERFHMDVDLLRALNPDTDFRSAGTQIVVVNRGSDELPRAVARIEVDKQAQMVRAFDGSDNLLGVYPATVGSESLPSPSGTLQVTRIATDPTYHYDPSKLSFGKSDKPLTLPAGPNNPVGSVWIALSRDGYGIHGSPEPAKISKSASHGCVRLTNWDAEELAGAASADIPVVFVGGDEGSETKQS